MNGSMIVVEGIDGSGKGTQTKLLLEYYKDRGIPSVLFEFPMYQDTFFGEVVGEFLNGDFGSIDDVHPKLAAMIYAGDRFEKSIEMKGYLSKGYNVICDRYVSSNIAHQISKLPLDKREELTAWINELEYEIYKIPTPSITIFLDMPPEKASDLVLKKEKRNYTDKNKDIHEADESYMVKTYNVFKELSKGPLWRTIECSDRDISSIHNDIVNLIKA